MNRPDVPLSPPRPVVRRFTAAYESECETCGGDIFEGDEAGYIGEDTRASCDECCDGAEGS
ncbi:hypothetical protein [Streptomyces chartreusis]